jgi:hypothetical protein
VGDLATDNDARRLWAAGLAAVQISTGQACHLEAGMVERGVLELEQHGVPLADLELLVIENVGNLVCPAAYDLGESLRVVMLSVTEGEDKPLKYAASFHGADLVLINKIDLLGAVEFDLDQCRRHIGGIDRGRAQPLQLLDHHLNRLAISQQDQAINAVLRHPLDQATQGLLTADGSYGGQQGLGDAEQHQLVVAAVGKQ